MLILLRKKQGCVSILCILFPNFVLKVIIVHHNLIIVKHYSSRSDDRMTHCLHRNLIVNLSARGLDRRGGKPVYTEKNPHSLSWNQIEVIVKQLVHTSTKWKFHEFKVVVVLSSIKENFCFNIPFRGIAETYVHLSALIHFSALKGNMQSPQNYFDR